jgi:hypothetical protein
MGGWRKKINKGKGGKIDRQRIEKKRKRQTEGNERERHR